MKEYKAKKLLPSTKAGLYYLEYCRVQAKDERIVYARQEKGFAKHISLPYKNVSVILLGSGTSITQAAARRLAEEEVMVAFTGGYGSPLFLASQNEYRPTEWMQKWSSFWFNEALRLEAAKSFLEKRAENTYKWWSEFECPDPSQTNSDFLRRIRPCTSQQDLLIVEASYAQSLYGAMASHYNTSFSRRPGEGDSQDLYNSFLDQGNYLAYGIAATALWICGISHAFPVLHGKTRRGALVFDVADTFKDALVLPTAFQCASEGSLPQEFRDRCTDILLRKNILYATVNLIQDTSQHFCDKVARLESGEAQGI